MREEIRNPDETLDEFIRRHYTVQWTDGEERPERMERARRTVLEANPHLKSDWQKAVLPDVEGIPRIRFAIADESQLHEAMHEVQIELRGDKRLLLLSFIDPLRLGCEELGIAFPPNLAASVRRRLEGQVSFDQQRYEEIRRGRCAMQGIERIEWTHRKPGM